MWSVAVMGFLSKILFAHRVEAVSIWIYLILGWMPTISASSLTDSVTSAGLYGMLIGGLFYTVGCVFLLLDSKVAYFHAVWHLFVIAGSTCHFFVILLYVAPIR
jgi:hemolysin III